MRWPVVVLAVAFALIVVTSPGAGVSGASVRLSSSVSSSIVLTTDAVPLPSAFTTRELPPGTPISLTLTLATPHASELTQFLSQVEDPLSPSYRHFLTSSEFSDDFGPPTSSVSSTKAVLEAAGAREITVAPDRAAVTAVIPAGSVEQLLGVHLVEYGVSGKIPLYTATGSVTLPAALQGLVAGVGGLSDRSTAVLAALKASSFPIRPVSKGVAEFVVNNSTASEWFLGSDYAQAYGAAELFPGAHSVANATYPTSVAIATLLASSYNGTTNTNLPPWDPAVIAAYFNGTLGPGWPNSTFTGVPVTLDNVTPPAPGSFGGRNDSTLFETENSLDLEMAGSMAPGASIYNFYIAASLIANATRLGDVADFFAWDLSAALNYSYSPAHLAVVSCSFGLTDLDNAFWDEELLRAAAMGVTVVAASGDQGNAPNQWSGRSDGQWPVWPATAATNLAGSVSVGGVSIDLAGSPNAFFNGSTLNLSYDSADGAISSVSAWYDTLGGEGQYAGTEGGISTVYSEPLWQFESAAQPAIVNATLTQGADVLGRAGPDVAMPANNTIATVYADTNGTIYFSVLEGTSVAAPVLAGLLADVVAVENNGSSPLWTSLGFLDPEIYQFASYFATHPNATGDPFLDVTQGANWVFSAAPGWDPTTGWGEVNGPLFLAADENSTLHHYVYTGPMPGLPPIVSNPSSSGPVPWPYIFAIFGVGLVLAIVLVALAARPSRPRPPPASVPWGAQGGGPTWGQGPPPPGGYPGATFLCPYCGAIRPAEPVRCPQCGAF